MPYHVAGGLLATGASGPTGTPMSPGLRGLVYRFHLRMGLVAKVGGY
jgi:hypothetical protein